MLSAYLGASAHHSPAADDRVFLLAVDEPFAPALGHHLRASFWIGLRSCLYSRHESRHYDMKPDTSKATTEAVRKKFFICVNFILVAKRSTASGSTGSLVVVGCLCVVGVHAV